MGDLHPMVTTLDTIQGILASSPTLPRRHPSGVMPDKLHSSLAPAFTLGSMQALGLTSNNYPLVAGPGESLHGHDIVYIPVRLIWT
jgi:hypothetical protein